MKSAEWDAMWAKPFATIDEQIAEVKRELALRANVYKKIPHMRDAELHMGRMQAVLDTLLRVKGRGINDPA